MANLTTTLQLNLVNDSTLVQLDGEGQIIRNEDTLIEIRFGAVTALATGDFTQGLSSTMNSLRLSRSGTQFLLLDDFDLLFSDFVDALENDDIDAAYRLIYAEADSLSGSNFADTLSGFEGDDRLNGRNGNDTLDGGSGNDVLIGASGNDNLIGGIGNDLMIGGTGADALNGGAGTDTASYQSSTQRNQADLQGINAGLGDAAGDTFSSIENLIGGNSIDILFGDAGENTITGGSGSDRVAGRAGDDVLNGGGGFDKLYGNAGQDIMTGGTGNDRFIYFNLSDSRVGATRRDVITDFESGKDRIEVQRLDADTTTGGNQTFQFIGTAGFSGTAGELRFFQSAPNGFTIIQADVDGDSAQDFQIELTGLIDLSAGDFAL
ncbi:MAG: M10 family metallopeptidase C-terminal domain-containing protein [Pseudomonadota bacterium]